jgi:hypothetical protein
MRKFRKNYICTQFTMLNECYLSMCGCLMKNRNKLHVVLNFGDFSFLFSRYFKAFLSSVDEGILEIAFLLQHAMANRSELADALEAFVVGFDGLAELEASAIEDAAFVFVRRVVLLEVAWN